MTNQLITYRLPIDYSLTSLMSSISYVWNKIKFHHFNSIITLYSTSTWRLMGSAWFPRSITFVQLTNELSWFTGQRGNGSI